MQKKIFVILLAVMIGLSACTGNTDNIEQSEGKNENPVVGGYVQESITLPEGEAEVRAMAGLADGRIRFVARTAIYEAAEAGAGWEVYEHHSEHLEAVLMSEAQQEQAGSRIAVDVICLHSDGSIFFGYDRVPWLGPEDIEYDDNGAAIEPELDQREWEHCYVVIDPDGSEHLLDIEEPLQQATFTRNGDILGLAVGEVGATLYLIERATAKMKQIVTMEYMESYISYKNQVVVLNGDGVETYDLDTGKLVANMPAVDAYFAEEDYGEYLLLPDEEQELIYIYASGKGIYRFTEAGAVAELVVDGSSNRLGNANNGVYQMVLLADESFLVFISGGRDESEFLYYHYSEEYPGVMAEFTVYSLVKDWYAENLVAEFNERNSQYKAIYEYGMVEGEMTISDALKKLSTEVLAGNGPDVFVMDDIPMDAYIENEILADLTDVTAASEAEFFENIISTYKEGDAVYAVPTSFVTQVIAGPREYLEQVSDLSSLAEFVEAARKGSGADQPSNVIGEYWDIELSSHALQISGNALLQQDGTISETELRDFLTNVKKIYEYNRTDYIVDFEFTEEDLGIVTYEVFPMREMKLADAVLHMEGQNQLLTGNISKMEELQTLFMICNELNFDYKIFDGMDQSVYMPLQVLAVNRQTEYMAAAEQFITFSLAFEAQEQSSWWQGLPVNITAYDQLYERAVKGPLDYPDSELDDLPDAVYYEVTEDDGSFKRYPFEAYYGTAEDYENFKVIAGTLDTPMMADSIVIDAILSETNKCLVGETGVAEAVDNIMRKINIYLAE